MNAFCSQVTLLLDNTQSFSEYIDYLMSKYEPDSDTSESKFLRLDCLKEWIEGSLETLLESFIYSDNASTKQTQEFFNYLLVSFIENVPDSDWAVLSEYYLKKFLERRKSSQDDGVGKFWLCPDPMV